MNLYRKSLRYLSPYKGNIALILLFNILYSLFSLVSLTTIVPFLSVLFGDVAPVAEKPELAFSSSSIINTFYYYLGELIAGKGKTFTLFATGLTMVIFSGGTNFFRYLSHFCMAPIRAGVLRNFRKDIYDKIISLPVAFFSQHKKGDLINRMGTDAQEVEWSFISSIQTFCRDPFLLAFSLCALFAVNAKLTVISLIILPLSGLLIAFVGKSIKRNAARAQEALGKMSAKFDETIHGLRIIKGYNVIDQTEENFKKENERYTQVYTKIHRINELGSPLVEFTSILSLVVILSLGSVFVFNDPLFRGEIFAAYILIFSRMLPPAKQLVTTYYTIQKGKAAARRIDEIMEAENSIAEDPDALPKTTFDQSIVFHNVSFSYQDDLHGNPLDVLHTVNATVRKGETVAIVGPSGSGKSTLADLLLRFYDTRQGEIRIDNTDIRKIALKDLRELIGRVNQETILFNDTVFNNIAFGLPSPSREAVEAAARMAQAHPFILEMPEGYDSVIGDRGMKLSGGQRQRISIARAFLRNPQILVLDEATSALDNESEYAVQQALEALLQGKTAIIIAHRLSTIRNAHRILFMKQGRIIECGTHPELMELGGEYRKFYEMQQV